MYCSNQNTNTHKIPTIMTNKSDRNEYAPNPKRTLSALLSPRKFQSEELAKALLRSDPVNSVNAKKNATLNISTHAWSTK